MSSLTASSHNGATVASVGSPLEHGLLLHESGDGLVAVAQKIRGKWTEKVHQVADLPKVLPTYAGQRDVYISQNRFRGWRGVARLAQLSALYVDLDYYRLADFVGLQAEGVFAEAMETLRASRLPRPSLAVSTGRGLALIWRHASISPGELPKWSLCQTHLWRALRPVGADRAATDAARVLRLVGTVNSKSGDVVQTIWTDLHHVWDFDDLAREILPDEPPEPQSSQRATLGAKRESGGAKRDPAQGFSVVSLNQARLQDLHRLMNLRGWRKLPPGRRDAWMLVAATCLSRLVRPEFLEREVCRLAREVAGWSASETKTRMQSVFKKAKEAELGYDILWQGDWKDPRYDFTNQRIIEYLEITPAEEQELKTIISEHTRRRRDRQRKEKLRREQDIKPRKEYLAEAKKKRRRAKRLRDKGYSLAQIARRIGCSTRHVSRLLSQ